MKRLNYGAKGLLSAGLLLFLVALLFFVPFSCRRGVEQQMVAKSNEFNMEAAKEWWYGSFRKSPEYQKRDFSSPLSTPQGMSTKKYPRWNAAIAYSIGSLQVVELPLVYETNSILLPGMSQLNQTPEGERVARAAVHKLMLVRIANGEIVVRNVTLVPTLDFAMQTGYDLSRINLQKLPPNFSGYQMIGGWDESVKNVIHYIDGKAIRRVKLIKRQTGMQRSPTHSRTNDDPNSCLQCERWVPKKVWACVIIPSGDDLADEEACRENGSWVDSQTEGTCESIPNCPDGDGPDPFTQCLNEGNTPEECMCQLYQLECGDDDWDGDGDEIDYSCYNTQENNFQQTIANSSTDNSDMSYTSIPVNDVTRNVARSWKCLNGFGGWSLISHETGVIKYVPIFHQYRWEWESLIHNSITKQGSTFPGVSVSYSQGVGTPYISSLYASMALSFSVTYNLVCDCPNIPIVGQLPPIDRNYNANSTFWPATP